MRLAESRWIIECRASLGRVSRVKKFIAFLVAVFVVLGSFTALAGQHLQPLLSSLVAHGGIPAYFLTIVLIHVLILPAFPDPLIAFAPILFPHQFWLVLLLSACAPLLAASIDLYLGSRYGRALLRKIGSERAVTTAEDLTRRYGAYGVALSAVMPLNFSLICWGCGILGVSRRRVMLAVFLTRVPRHILVYLFGNQILRMGDLILRRFAERL
jgi:membrane protein YqaA with SNARE-associated domain